MRHFAAAIATAAFLSGCATQQMTTDKMREYIAANYQRAVAGQMRWSEYMFGLRDLAYAGNTPQYYRSQLDIITLAAVDLDAGKISAEEFARIRAESRAALERDARDAAHQEQVRQANSIAMMQVATQLMAQSAPRPIYVAPAADYDWDWDEQYDGANRLVWVCRGVQSGQYAEPSRCGYKMRADIRWPGKYAN